MKQQGKTLSGANLQLFLDSAANAARQGPQQFFTPRPLAESLMAPLRRLHISTAFDPHAGDGRLLKATLAPNKLGTDIDPRSTGRHIHQADCTLWHPLAVAAGLEFDLIVCNPPFSLLWHADRLASLRHSHRPHVAESFDHFVTSGRIDSTAATLLMAVDRLTDAGEGFMLCNADTARRLLGAPASDPLAPIRRHIWLWLDVPGFTFHGQNRAFDLTVLYFAAGHENPHGPHHLTARSADPATVAEDLRDASLRRPLYRHGREVTAPHFARTESTLTAWKAVAAEYQRRHTPDTHAEWNIWLGPDGTIRRDLTTFQRLSVPAAAIDSLHRLQGAHPASLIVQHESRANLQRAVHSGIWRVRPDVIEAVEQAIRDYSTARAPFYSPSPTHALGWIDEESHLTARRSTLHGIRDGDTCTLRTWTEDTVTPSTRVTFTGETVDTELRGKQLVVELTAPSGAVHHFHVTRDPDDEPETQDLRGNRVFHHDIQTLLDNFHIPLPPDIAAAHPDAFAAHLATLDRLETLINSQP